MSTKIVIPRCLHATQTNMSHPDPSSVDDKEFMEKSFSQMCQQLTTVVEERFEHFKRELSADDSATPHAFSSKRARLEKPQFKSKGNEQQYDHQLSVLECVHRHRASRHR